MFETEKKFSILNQEYNDFINEIVANAVEPPMEKFQNGISEDMSKATKSLLAARKELLDESTQLVHLVERQVQELIEPFENAKLTLMMAVPDLTEAKEEISKYAETVINTQQQIASFYTEFHDKTNLLKTLIIQAEHKSSESAQLSINEHRNNAQSLAEYFYKQIVALQQNLEQRLDNQQIYLTTSKENLLQSLQNVHTSLNQSESASRLALEQKLAVTGGQTVKLLLADLSELKTKLENQFNLLSSNFEYRSQNLNAGMVQSRVDFEQSLSKIKTLQEELKKQSRALLWISGVMGVLVIIVIVLLVKILNASI